jgi:hypothetical protein
MTFDLVDGDTERRKHSRQKTLQKYNAKPTSRAKRKAWFKTPSGKASLHKHYTKLTTILRHSRKRVLRRHAERWPDEPSTLMFDDLFSIWNRQRGRCALSGIEMTWGRGTILATSMSIDRIEQSRGYHADNLRFLCHNVNAFRGTGTDAEMIAMAKAIIDFTTQTARGIT